jgi:hypothetical protein
MNNPAVQTVPSQTPSRNDCLSSLIFGGLLGWIILITFGLVFGQFLSSLSPSPANSRSSLIYTASEFILLGLPLLVLANFWQNQRLKSIFKTWAWAVAFTLLLIPVQLTGQLNTQAKACLQIVLSSLFVALVLFRTHGGPSPLQIRLGRNDRLSRQRLGLAWFLALLMAAFVAYPWLAWGALGSFLDTTLDVLAALSVGLAAGLILERFLLQSFPGISPGTETAPFNIGEFILGGFSIGATLVIIASGIGFSFGGTQLLLMVMWPALGWALMGLAKLAVSGASRLWSIWLPLAALIGLAAAAPMALIDPDELALVISITPGEILHWAFQAAIVSAFTGLALGLLMLLFLVRLRRQDTQPTLSSEQVSVQKSGFNWAAFFGVAALLAWLAGAGIYFIAGQPGFYGERMFVVLHSQPDLSSAPAIQDYNQRREFVYHTLVENANTTQAGLRKTLDALGLPYTPYYLVNGLEVPANPLLRLWLASRPEVDRVLESPHMRPLPEIPPAESGVIKDAPSQPEWNLTNIGADRVWNELHITGEGVVVGQSDSGVQVDHPELANSYRGKDGQNNYNWFDPWNDTTSPTDTEGHGTHTLGTVLGEHTGVAPGANWIGCVNLARNLGNPAVYLDCMQFMLAPFPQGGDPLKDGDPRRSAMVLNNSWGCPDMEGCDANALLPAVRALRAAGLFVVASAGNDGPKCKTLNDPPTLYAEVFSIGAINQFGQLADFSSRGPVTADDSQRVKPDIVAPGEDVLSSLPGNSYGSLSGTSMAGPHVAGVVALMWSANQALIGDIDRTDQILEQTATPYAGALPICPGADGTPSTAVGYGIVDAYAAVKAALQAKTGN